jgi:UDP-glucose 4-epimerase
VAQVIEAARAVTGRPIPAVMGARRAGDPPVLGASSGRARTELGWQPLKQDLQVILADAWAWLEAHPEGYR